MKKTKSIADWRKRIDGINRRLLWLLRERAEAALKIGDIKKKSGMAISDPAREKAILNELAGIKAAPLDARAVRSVFSAVIRETKRIERGAAR